MRVLYLCVLVVYDVCMCGWVVQGGCVGLSWVCMCMYVCILSVCVCVCVPMNTVLQMISRECV